MPAVVHVEFEKMTAIQYSTGAVMMIAAIIVIIKIKSRSGNNFAYTLMGFTLLMGLGTNGLALTYTIR